jgi:sugar/nucleoside kinase (ribokinase family)
MTVDVVAGERVAGGAVTYGARAAAAALSPARILTIAGPDAELTAFEGHELEVVLAECTMTLELGLDEHGSRTLRVVERPERSLDAADLPAKWREGPQPSVLLLAPLLPGDVDVPSFAGVAPRSRTGLLAQGMQREVGADGTVRHVDGPAAELLEAAEHVGTVFLSDEETGGWPQGALRELAKLVPRLVITRGSRGTDIHAADRVCRVEARPATVVDTTGAGDVFATTYMLAESEGRAQPGRVAAVMAACAVERAGPARLPAWSDIGAAIEAQTEPRSGGRER